MQILNETQYDFDWKTLSIMALRTPGAAQCLSIFDSSDVLATATNSSALPAQYIHAKARGQIPTSASSANCVVHHNSEQYWLVKPIGFDAEMVFW